MAPEEYPTPEFARTAPPESIALLLGSTSEEVLQALLENPAVDETHICILLERKDLSGSLIEEIAKRKIWMAGYRVRRALAAHPHTPRLIAVKVLRELYLMDLVRTSLMPAVPGELRRLAEERILVQLPQLPLGQRLMLARRGSARVAAGLIAQGPEQVAHVALDNSFLTESQLLKTLTKNDLPHRIVAAVAHHRKWSTLMNVRVALLRHPRVPVESVPALIADLPRHDLEALVDLAQMDEGIRTQLLLELSRRIEANHQIR